MAVGFSNTNKPLNPRGQDASPKGYNRAALYSGKALDFDGVNDYVTFDGFAGTLSNNDAWTACGYFKTDSNTRATWFSAHHSSGSNRIRVGVDTNKDGLFYADIYTGDVQIGDFDFKDNQWHFVALSREQGGAGSLLTLYVDGVELTSLGTGIDWDTATQFSLGQEYDGASLSDFWNGLLSNFKIFNTALTAEQVADLYNNPEKVVPTGVGNTALKLWLPMMEGAGTTAYDGSGNGNHGTISGATYVNGIGAPVAQSAVMDWNKGSNYVDYSNDFTQSSWTTPRSTLTSGQSGVLGSSDAWKIESNATGYTGGYDNTTSLNVVNCSSIYAKAGNIDYLFITSTQGSTNNAQYFNLSTGTLGSLVGSGITSADIEDVGDGWYRCSVVMSANASFGYMLFGIANTDGNNGSVSGEYIYVQNAQLNNGSSVQPYTPTIGTPQTSEVLLPQGLTTGRDITGVNLFENVRKQGALNLDGNSWAEVHDNASLDITTAITLEAWVYYDGSNGKGLLGRWSTGSDNNYLLYTSNISKGQFYINTTAVSVLNTPTLTTGNWYHLVGTYDGSDMRIYLNGSEETNTSKTGSISTSSEPIEIGRYLSGTAYQYNNSIAQPRIYNRALTAEEVQRSYDSGKNIYTNS